MEVEGGRRPYEGPYQASLYFCDELKEAIATGIAKDIEAALEEQDCNSATEGISNALLCRSFLLRHKEELVALQHSIMHTKTVNQAAAEVWLAARSMGALFHDTFVSEDASDQYAKLSGDELFREALKMEGKNASVITRRIAEADLMNLDEPSEVYAQMEGLVCFSADDLFGKAQAFCGAGDHAGMTSRLVESIDFHIGLVDEKLKNNLSKAQ